ncbi:hypothetical protein JCM10207_002826 [Rhodosporidiobolus poonsookiae]
MPRGYPLQQDGASGSTGGTPDPFEANGGMDDDLDQQAEVDLSDPLQRQELEAFGTGPAEETLPAPPANPNAVVQQQQQQQGGQAAAAAEGTATPTSGAGAKRTLAASGPIARAKRPKNVKLSPTGKGKQLVRRAAAGAVNGEVVMLPNNDYCDACGGKGNFLCCEGGCLRSFHFQCLEPPLDIDEVPDESWYCKSCRAAAHPPAKPPRSYFSDLIYKVETENPKQFTLTNELKGFLKNVASGTTGEFIDSTEHRPPSKITGRAIGQEDRDGYRLKDKNGRSIICYNCDESAQPAKYRRIISCDFCDQHWHLDCLDPPMTGMPPPTRKWMCPVHSDHLLPKKRTIKNVQTIPVERRDEPNNGDIVIQPARERGGGEDVEEIVVNRVRYQVPEQHVILDFWGRVTEGPRSRRKPSAKSKKNRSPRKQSGYDSGNSSPLTDLTSSDESDSDTEREKSKTPASSALDSLALLAEVRYIDLLNSSSAGVNGAASSSKDKGKARALPPALPASTQRRAGRPSLPALPGARLPIGVPGTPSNAAIPSRPGASPSVSPAPSYPSASPAAGSSAAATASTPGGMLSELTVESKDDLQALTRVRKLLAAQTAAAKAKEKDGLPGKDEDEARRATMLGFLEGAPILPKLGFIKAESSASPWSRPWEQQKQAGARSAHQHAAKRPTPSPLPSPALGAVPSASYASAAVPASAAPTPSPATPAANQPNPLDTPAIAGSNAVSISKPDVPTPSANAAPPPQPAAGEPSESPMPFSLPVSMAARPAPAPVATSQAAPAVTTAASEDAVMADGAGAGAQ